MGSIELKALQRSLGITFIYVTHDQSEALSMSDRVAVFNHGKIEQLDTPRGLYGHPKTEFVARFVGSANVLEGHQIGLGEGKFALRPERVRITPGSEPGMNRLLGKLLDVHYLGSQTRYEVEVGGTRVTALTASDATVISLGSTVTLSWDAASLRPLSDGVSGPKQEASV